MLAMVRALKGPATIYRRYATQHKARICLLLLVGFIPDQIAGRKPVAIEVGLLASELENWDKRRRTNCSAPGPRSLAHSSLA